MSQSILNYSGEFSGIVVESNKLVFGTMSVSTLSLPSAPSVVEFEGGILYRNGIESEYLR